MALERAKREKEGRKRAEQKLRETKNLLVKEKLDAEKEEKEQL